MNNGIGKYVIKARKDKGMTQKQLATLTGMTLQDVRNIEHGIAISVKNTMILADVLEIPYFKLLIDKDQHNGPKCNVGDCEDLYKTVNILYDYLISNVNKLDMSEDNKEHYIQRLIYSYGVGLIGVYNKILDTYLEAKKEEKRGKNNNDEYCKY